MISNTSSSSAVYNDPKTGFLWSEELAKSLDLTIDDALSLIRFLYDKRDSSVGMVFSLLPVYLVAPHFELLNFPSSGMDGIPFSEYSSFFAVVGGHMVLPSGMMYLISVFCPLV